MGPAERNFRLFPQGHPILIHCVPHWVPKFSHPCDSKDPSHAQSNLKVGNPQASSCVKPSHTSLTKLPPEVTQGSLLSPQGPCLLLSTFASTAWKGRLQNLKSSPTGSENGPVQFPLQTQGRGGRRRRRSQPWAPEEAQHHLEHPKVSHPLHPHSPAQLGGAQYAHSSITSELCPCQ